MAGSKQTDFLRYADALLEITGSVDVAQYRIKTTVSVAELHTAVDAALCFVVPEGLRYNLVSPHHGLHMHGQPDDQTRVFAEYWGSGGVALTVVSTRDSDLATRFIAALSMELGAPLIVDTPFQTDKTYDFTTV